MNDKKCPLCGAKLIHNPKRRSSENDIYICNKKCYPTKVATEPHYYVDWFRETDKGYPYYECAIWEKKNKVFCLETDFEQEYCLSVLTIDDCYKIFSIYLEHDYKPIKEVISRLEKISVFA
jgi:hypothetical protein